jgi:hypothetical protein
MWYFWSARNVEPIINYITAIEENDLNQLKILCQDQTVNFETIRSWTVVDKRCFDNSLNLLQLAFKYQSITPDVINYLVEDIGFKLDLSTLVVAIRYGNVQGITILFQRPEIRKAYAQQLDASPKDIEGLHSIMDESIEGSVQAVIKTILQQHAPKPPTQVIPPSVTNIYFMWASLQQRESQNKRLDQDERTDNNTSDQNPKKNPTGCVLS